MSAKKYNNVTDMARNPPISCLLLTFIAFSSLLPYTKSVWKMKYESPLPTTTLSNVF